MDFGTVYLTGILSDVAAKQGQIVFDPIPRVDGIERSHDPLYQPRTGVNLMSGGGRGNCGTLGKFAGLVDEISTNPKRQENGLGKARTAASTVGLQHFTIGEFESPARTR